MIKDNLYFNAQPKLKAGIDKVARAVGITMGTGGSNTIIEAIESPGHMPTNDGFTIANSIHLEDPIEDMGRKMLVEAINRANKASGDGSSTTCVLTAAIIEEGLAVTSLESDAPLAGQATGDANHPMDVKRSMEDCLDDIEKSLETQTRIIDVKEVGQVATISAEDPAIGAMIQEIYEQIGPKGLIYWDVSKTASDTYTLGQGITVDGAGFVSPYMCDAAESGQNTNQIRITNPKILITKQKISSAADFESIGAALFAKDVRDLVVFCDDIDPLVIPDIVKTRMMRGFRFAIVKMPVLWKDWWYEDLAKATGATVIDPTAGIAMRQANETHLGTVGNIVITKDDTFLDGIADVTEYVKELEGEATDEGAMRAARLNTKTARYFVGAHSDSALSYRRFKVEDAISAAYQALNGGIVPGGGSALLNVSAMLKKKGTTGAKILAKALEAPARQIYANAGVRVPDNFLFSGTDIGGFDSRTRTEIGDMFKAGIIDPKNVVLNAVRNAVSVGSSIITAPTIITLPRDTVDADPLQREVIAR